MRLFTFLAWACAWGAFGCGAPTRGTVEEPQASRIPQWRAWAGYLEPRPEEERWRQIPWLESFGEGLAQARRSSRPLLLWVMNGHPLGCT